jgi:Flp pilus assembly protein TadD
MKKAKRQARSKTAQSSTAPAVFPWKSWRFLAGLLVALFAVFEAYRPALNGPFLFDDTYLPFGLPGSATLPFRGWITNVRPFLMFTYWVNYRISGAHPFLYHLLNILFHLGGGLMVFLIVRRLLEWAGVNTWPRDPIALFAGGLFLLHPLQTEAVSYVASRSENLSVLLFYSAYVLFLYRRSAAVTFPVAIGIMVLFAGAVTVKEHTAVLPALLLFTDYFWNPGFSFQGIRRNWRLYVPMAVAATLSMRFVWTTLAEADTAGFGMKNLPWDQYFFTECRAIWVYLRMFLLPYGQSVDHVFATSRSITDHGAILGMAGLVVLLGAAWWFRRRYPLASFGIVVFLLLLAPTSSVVPIKDTLVERRVYLPSIGLLLVAAEFLRRWKASSRAFVGALAAVLVVAAVLTYQRNQVWASSLALWQDTVAKSPENPRAHFQLAFAYFQLNRCAEAVGQYERAAQLEPADYRLLVDWALAYDCAGRSADALAKLKQAATMQRSAHVYSLIGMAYAKQDRRDEAFQALETAIELDPHYAMTYVYLGNLYAMAGDDVRAVEEYRRALQYDNSLDAARNSLVRAEQRLREKAQSYNGR